ncbi:uncharacterized protein LOC131260519 [Anopheles coustani]|uniref:uncharacterized protein LOC131260519 n=1 Tax=Anopheles coustani TaxID=139045 RepID=UPI002657E1B0|nr:uncharacterized protein LOC131260519 [Anopheles coustani]
MAHFIWQIWLTSVLILFIPQHTVHAFQCYQCMNITSFEQCSKSATIVNCEDHDQEASQQAPTVTPALANVSYACATVNLEIFGIQSFIKSCTRNFSEATICTALAEQTEGTMPGTKVNVCNVCYSELCNTSSSATTFGVVLVAICMATLNTVRYMRCKFLNIM